MRKGNEQGYREDEEKDEKENARLERRVSGQPSDSSQRWKRAGGGGENRGREGTGEESTRPLS